MRIWLSERFWDSAHRLFPKKDDRETVKDVLVAYANAGNDRLRLQSFEQGHVMKPMKGCAFVRKFYLRGNGVSVKGTRVICISLDEGRAAFLHRLNPVIQPAPDAGDSLLLGVELHDRQGEEARRLERRFLEGARDVCRIEPFPPVARPEDPTTARKRTVTKNAGLYVSKTPFESYADYLAYVERDEARLSQDQFDILQDILDPGTAQPVPFFVTGCAGSGKTLLAATALNLLPNPENASNAYFVLSKRLRGETEDQTIRIALSKLRWDASEAEATWINDILEPPSGSGFGERLSPGAIADRASTEGFPNVSETLHDLPAFLTLNEYLFELMSEVPALSDVIGDRPFEEAFVDDAKFREWFREWRGDREDELRCPDVWTEIKGVIKGYLGAAKALKIDETRHWNWGNNVFPLGQNERDLETTTEIARNTWGVLEQLGIALFAAGSYRLAKADAASVERARAAIGGWTGTERDECLACLDRILLAAGFGNRPDGFVDHRKAGLTQDEYLELPRAQSIHDEDSRRRIYQLYCEYEEWKRHEGMVDGNDLARIAAAWFSDPGHERPFGTVVADECQDFTEMQLLAMKRLGRNENGMILAGDQHQMINPTFFDPDRIQAMFPQNGERLRSRTLSYNYRSTQEITGFSNRIARKRREWIGSRGLAGEQDERSANQGPPPDFWTAEENELSSFLDRQLEDPTFRVLVYDDKDRAAVLGRAGKPDEMKDRIVTIRECKGLEFKKVLCFNLLGRYSGEWATIRSGAARHNEHFRYFFNSLYVAATRSQSRLGFFEPDAAAFTDNAWLVDEGRWRRGIPQDAWPIDRTRFVHDAVEEGDKIFDNAEESENPAGAYGSALRFYRQAEEKWNPAQPVSLNDIRQRIAKTLFEIARCEKRNADEAIRFCLLHGVFKFQTKGGTPLERLYENRKNGNVFEGMDGREIKTVVDILSKDTDYRLLLDELVQLQAHAVCERARFLIDNN